MECKKILVVDDSKADLFFARVIIESFDPKIEIVEAIDGQEAFEVLGQLEVQPNAIFLDINMPVMNGHEFLEAYAKRDEYTAQVVMLTSSSQQQDIERCRAYPFVVDYWVKPLDAAALEELLKPASPAQK